ncbi:O-antigen ligase family protein [Pontibacter toksunensis]
MSLQLFLFIFLSISIFFLASRIAIVLYIVILPLLLLKHVWHRLSWYSIVAGCATVVLIFFAIVNYVPVVKHRFANDINLAGKAYESDNPGTGMMMRLVFWRTAIEVIEQNPLFGVGTGDGQDALDIHYEERNLNSLLGYNPHNQYLHTGVMLGLIGTFYLLLTLLLPSIVAFRRGDTIYQIFLLIISVSFLTESVLQGNKGIVFYALFNALYFFYYSPYEVSGMKKGASKDY